MDAMGVLSGWRRKEKATLTGGLWRCALSRTPTPPRHHFAFPMPFPFRLRHQPRPQPAPTPAAPTRALALDTVAAILALQ